MTVMSLMPRRSEIGVLTKFPGAVEAPIPEVIIYWRPLFWKFCLAYCCWETWRAAVSVFGAPPPTTTDWLALTLPLTELEEPSVVRFAVKALVRSGLRFSISLSNLFGVLCSNYWCVTDVIFIFTSIAGFCLKCRMLAIYLFLILFSIFADAHSRLLVSFRNFIHSFKI